MGTDGESKLDIDADDNEEEDDEEEDERKGNSVVQGLDVTLAEALLKQKLKIALLFE